VRLGACDLRCRWCDSPHTWAAAKQCRLEESRGSGRFRSIPNPIALSDVMAAAETLDVGAHRFASLTGGEPLLQPEAVRALATALRARGPRILLETHGLAAEAMEQLADVIDVVSMDWKLASDVRPAARDRTGPFHDAHERFLRAARRAPEVLIKVVVTPASEDAELDEMAERLARVDSDLPVIVQPVPPFGPVKQAPSPERLLALVIRLSSRLGDVRLIPQTHKGIGLL
jgi:organic radical activating enzyme